MERKVVTVGEDAPWDEELRSWLKKHLAEHPHLNTTILSRSQYIGMSRQALDSYLKGKYFLPKSAGGKGIDRKTSKVEDLIRAYRERIELPVRHASAGEFVKTDNWFKLQSACQTAVNNRVIVVVYGRPGIGKSRCLSEFALQRLITYPVCILCSRNIAAKYFVDEIAREIEAKKQTSIAATEGEIVRRLLLHPRPLFIDQSNFLPERCLGTLCYLWEKTKVPIVLVGTTDLYTAFIQSTVTEDARAQISSRVTMFYHLSGLSEEEARIILQRWLGEDATDEAVSLIYKGTGGVFRYIETGIHNILQLKALNTEALASGEMTMLDLIRIALSRLKK
jgi:hypothetical protein